jgi:hypothetical protein
MFVLFGNDNWVSAEIFTIFLAHKIVSRKSRFNISNEIQGKFQKIVFSSERVIRSGPNRVRPVQKRKIEPFGRVFHYFCRIFSRSWDIHEKPIPARIIGTWWVEASKLTILSTRAKFKFFRNFLLITPARTLSFEPDNVCSVREW